MFDSNVLYSRRGKRIYIKQPILEELEFVSNLWADKETMKDIGGVFEFPKSKWEGFYKKMVYPSDGKNFYCLIYLNEGNPIGEVSFHGYDSATKVARFNIKILSKYRNKGFGEEAVKLLLEYYFIDFGGEMIMDNISTEAGIKLAKKMNFNVMYHQNGDVNVRLSKDEFLEKKELSNKNVGLLVYENMNVLDFTLAKEIFTLCNEMEDGELFKLHEINYDYNIEKSALSRDEKIDIIFIPGGNNLDNEDLEKLNSNFNSCDYICIKADNLSGIYGNVKKNFVDNGKIMVSYNLSGEIEMLLKMITKVCGRRLSNNIATKLGCNSAL